MLAAVLVPVYWVMMSVAAVKAMWQLRRDAVLLGEDDPRAAPRHGGRTIGRVPLRGVPAPPPRVVGSTTAGHT